MRSLAKSIELRKPASQGMKSVVHRLQLNLLLLSSRSCNMHGLSSSLSSLLSYKHSFSSSSTSSPVKYEDFFPCFDTEYHRRTIDWYCSPQLAVDETCMQGEESFEDTDGKYCREVPCLEDKPQYIYNFDDPIPIQKGHRFDVISLLSAYSDHLVRIGPSNSESGLVKADDLRGKYVLLCCALLPCVWNTWESNHWRQLSLLHSELSQTGIGSHFEMVIVSKMRKGWDDDEGAFHHSLSAFPGCLTVPFTYKYPRDYICKSLNLDGPVRYILVDQSNKVLLQYPYFSDILKFGARGFPFTEEHMRSLLGEDDWGETLKSCNKTLAGLLSYKSNPSFLLHKFDSEETVSVEQLNNHLVGLYLFKKGDRLKSFHNLYQECRNQGLDFEIVLVCLHFSSINPNDFQDIVLCAMKKHRVSNWWVFPFNNSACRRLDNLSYKSSNDSMIIVGPHNKFVDRQGGDVVSVYGSNLGTQIYPFTMEAVLQHFVQRLETITVESFLGTDYVYRDYECDDSKRMPLSELKGKNFFVIMASALAIESVWIDEYEDLAEWYDIIKEKDSSFEVIFVQITLREYPKPSSEIREAIFESKMKFLICPFDEPKHPEIVWNHDAFLLSCGIGGIPTKGLPIPSVLGFGKDGRLQTLNAHRFLTDHGLDAYPSLVESRNRNLNLCSDVRQQLWDEYGDQWEDYRWFW